MPILAQTLSMVFHIGKYKPHGLATRERMEQSEVLILREYLQNQFGYLPERIRPGYTDGLPAMLDFAELVHLMQSAIDAVHGFNFEVGSGLGYLGEERFGFHWRRIGIEFRAWIKFDGPVCQRKHHLVPASVIESICQAE